MANEYYYPWYPAHYRRDAGHLDHLSDSCYRRLIDAYMEGGEPIKKDAVRLMFIMRVTPEQFSLVWPQIEGFFILDEKGFLHHKRCDIELDRQDTLTKHKSLGGQRSAEKRRIQREQNQLLGNSSSTAVQQQFNSSSTAVQTREGKVREDNINITNTVPVAAREGSGHANGHKNGFDKNLDINPLRASRAFQRKFTSDEKREAWKQKMIQFMRVHWSADATREAIDLSLSDNPADQRRAKEIFNAADVDYKYRKTAGTLEPMDHV